MKLNILCTPTLTVAQDAWLEKYAKEHKISKEDAVRCAVSDFCAQCVPTQNGGKVR